MALTQNERSQLIGGLVENGWDEDMVADLTDNQLVAMDQPDELDQLVDNAAAFLELEDEEEDLTDNADCSKTLNEYTDNELMGEMKKRKGKKRGNMGKGKKKPPFMKKDDEEEEEKPAGNSASPCGEQRQQLSVNQYIAKLRADGAPQQVIDMVTNAQVQQDAERAELIEAITANEANDFTESELKASQLPTLRRLARLARSGTQRRSGWGDYTANAGGGGLVGNNEVEEPLDIPDLGWDSNNS